MSRWDFGGNFADATATAITRYFLEHGAEAPSSRRIAEGAGMSPSSLSNHFGGREVMLRMSAASWATFHEELLHDRVRQREWDGFLPADDEELAEARAWLCWRAMAIGDAEMSAVIAKAQRAQERILRDQLHDDGAIYAADSLPIRVSSSYLDGLVASLIDPLRPLPREDISRAWQGHRLHLLDHGEAA